MADHLRQRTARTGNRRGTIQVDGIGWDRSNGDEDGYADEGEGVENEGEDGGESGDGSKSIDVALDPVVLCPPDATQPTPPLWNRERSCSLSEGDRFAFAPAPVVVRAVALDLAMGAELELATEAKGQRLSRQPQPAF
jgi:hypothetical protein